MDAPTDRIRIIERSLRCFFFGLLSLIPLIGLGLAMLAIRLHFKTWAASGGEWNPAGRYLLAGYCLAWLSILLTLGAVASFAVFLIRHFDYQ